MEHTGIGVLESIWWRKRNTSVRGLFDLISDLNCGNQHGYHYEMVNCTAAAKETIGRFGRMREIKYAYIATHGDHNNLIFEINDQKLKRSDLRSILHEIKQINGSTLKGLYLGACSIGSKKVADYLFEGDICVNWICGYKEQVDWVKSSAFDMLFFNELINRSEGKTEMQTIQCVSNYIRDNAMGLAIQLGFGIFVRKQKTGGSKNILIDEE